METNPDIQSSAEVKSSKKRLSKQGVAAIVIVSVLAIAFSVFLPLYIKNNKANKELYEKQQIKITAYGEEIGVFTLNELLELGGVDEVEFSATYDTSNSEPVQKTYTGVELKTVLAALNIDLTYAHNVTFKASDGANKLYSPADVTADNNVFIAYKVNGNIFNKGIRSAAFKDKAEDGGPFVVIRVSDVFSQNRCKLLTEVVIA